ncbi:MAG: dihydrofolate reductase family protein [Anaeroplasmataceae bacterium]
MRKVVLYIAVSLDGFIADKNEGVSWIAGDNSDPSNQGSYNDFSNTIDTVILGYKTYNQIITELSVDKWIYDDKKTYVLTSKNITDKHNIYFKNNLIKLINDLKQDNGKNVWICGGASIVNQLRDYNLIDQYIITVVPTILGEGIKLFENKNYSLNLKLVSTKSYNGFVDLVYDVCK